jgi:hypothetical protein
MNKYYEFLQGITYLSPVEMANRLSLFFMISDKEATAIVTKFTNEKRTN